MGAGIATDKAQALKGFFSLETLDRYPSLFNQQNVSASLRDMV